MLKKYGMLIVCMMVLAVFCSPPVNAEVPAAATRQEQEKSCEKKLTELDKNMNELSAEFRKAEGKTQAEMNRLYEEFKKQQDSAGKDLEELRKSTNETWDKAKMNMDKAIEDLNGLYERTKTKVGGKDKSK